MSLDANQRTIEGVKIAYTDTKGIGYPLVCIHGNSCSKNVFRQLIPLLHDEYRLITLDLPGHGKSENAATNEQYSIVAYAKLVNSLAEELNLAEYGVIGYSLGGNIALQWSQIATKISAIALIASAPMHYSEKAMLAYPPYEGNLSAHPNAFTEKEAKEYMSACGFHCDEEPWTISDAMRTDPLSRAAMVASVLAGTGIDETRIVSSLNCPLTMIIGEDDRGLDYQYLSNLNYNQLWQEQIFVLPHETHACIFNAAQKIAPLLKAFFPTRNNMCEPY